MLRLIHRSILIGCQDMVSITCTYSVVDKLRVSDFDGSLPRQLVEMNRTTRTLSRIRRKVTFMHRYKTTISTLYFNVDSSTNGKSVLRFMLKFKIIITRIRSLREGNAFSHVCLCVHRVEVSPCDHYP